MRRWARPGILLAIAALFLILNRGAYQSYFQDDELDNLTWAPRLSALAWIAGLISPFFSKDNFRPAGHFYFYLLGNTAHLQFFWYVAVLQALHLINGYLVWQLAKNLGLKWWTAIVASSFFVLTAAALPAYWEPMYVFDVLCCTFSLLCILFYVHARYIVSFLAFWLAYKSKELAVMLPAVLLTHEYLLGARRGKRLIPFFIASLSFGLQGVLLNPNTNNPYTFHFTGNALARTVPFYASFPLLFPFSGFVFVAMAAFSRDRRVWFGVGTMFLFLAPLLFLPGRLYDAYGYIPLLGAAIALGASSERVHPAWAVLFFLCFVPWNIRHLRSERKQLLARAEQVRPYLAAVFRYARAHPVPPAIVFRNEPTGYAHWGVSASAKLAWNRLDIQPLWIDSPEATHSLHGERVAYMVWDPPSKQLHIIEKSPEILPDSYLYMDMYTPPWQLTNGFGAPERDPQANADFRQISSEAEAQVWQPAGSGAFDGTAFIAPNLFGQSQAKKLVVVIDGIEVGRVQFPAPGKIPVRFPIAPTSTAHLADIRFSAIGEPRDQGIAIESFGFRTSGFRASPHP